MIDGSEGMSMRILGRRTARLLGVLLPALLLGPAPTAHAGLVITETSYVVAADNWAGRSGTHTIKIVNRAPRGHPHIDVDGFIVLS
jgi:hypothetical protein